MKNKYTILFWTLLAVLFFARLLYVGWGPLDLSPDEAHYWDWSRHLDISYYSKGPFIAYNISMGTWLDNIIGVSPPNPSFWVRLPAVINSIILGIIAWLLANRLWKSRKISFYIIMILLSIPIYSIGSFLMTIDSPLMLFWALYIYLVFMALDSGKSKYWYFSGIVLGLGFLCKYTMIIFIPCIFLYFVSVKEHRYWLKKKDFYFGLLIALLFFLPVFVWNANNSWIGFKHLLGQAGFSANSLNKPFLSVHILELIGAQLGVVSPIIFILITYAFVRAWILRADWKYSFLFFMGVPLGIFYLILSFHKECQPNWLAPVYFTGALLAGSLFYKKRILKYGIVLGILMWVAVLCIDFIPGFPNKLDPTIRVRGWKKLGMNIGYISKGFEKEGPYFIFSDRYQITSELAFYTPGQPQVYCINLGRRMNQYDLWDNLDKLKGYNAIYVKHRDQEMGEEVADLFNSYRKLPLINIRLNDRLIHQYSVFLCENFKDNIKERDEITY